MKLTKNVKRAEQFGNYAVRMTLLKDRIAEAMAEADNMKAAELARRVGVSRATVTAWLNGDTKELKGNNLTRVAEELNVRPQWLADNKKPKRPAPLTSGVRETSESYGTGQAPRFKRIPLISSVAAGEFSPATDPFPVGNGDDDVLIDTVAFPIGSHAFALRIKGDSMREEYLAGDIIVIDPDAEPQPREPVVAKRDEDDEATFKLYIPKGKDDEGYPIIELQPINTHFPTLVISREHPGRVIGPMVARIQGRRRH